MTNLVNISTHGHFGVAADRIMAIAVQGYYDELQVGLLPPRKIDITGNIGKIMVTKRGYGVTITKRSGEIVIK